MTFDLLELSRHGGRPIGLLRLARGNVLALYTTASRPITIGLDTYQPLPISRSALRDSTDRRKNSLTITMPVDADCASWWRPYPPGRRVDVTWLAMHFGDGEVTTEWTGRVIATSFTDSELELNCEQSKATARTRGRFLRWMKGCTFALYDLATCRVDKALHAVAATLTIADGVALEAAAFATFPDGRLAGGMVEWIRPDGESDFRTIMAHEGTAIVLNYGTEDLDDGSEVTVYPGCKHNAEDCDTYFNNGPNYGGAKNKPIRSPFDGNLPG